MNSIVFAIVQTATGVPKPSFDDNSATPTWVGFAFTFGVAAVVVLLSIDLVRRIRRVRYRGEIREQLEAERAEGERAADERAGDDKGDQPRD